MGEMPGWSIGEEVAVVHLLDGLDVEAQLELDGEVVAVDEDAAMVCVEVEGLATWDGLWFPMRAFNLDSTPFGVVLGDAELVYEKDAPDV